MHSKNLPPSSVNPMDINPLGHNRGSSSRGINYLEIRREDRVQNNEILLAEYGQIYSHINDFGSLLEQDSLLVYKELLDDVMIQMGTLHRKFTFAFIRCSYGQRF